MERTAGITVDSFVQFEVAGCSISCFARNCGESDKTIFVGD